MDGRQGPRDRHRPSFAATLGSYTIQANLLLSELHGFAALGIADVKPDCAIFSRSAYGDAGALRQLGLLASASNADLLRPLLAHRAAWRCPPSMPCLLHAGGSAGAPETRAPGRLAAVTPHAVNIWVRV